MGKSWEEETGPIWGLTATRTCIGHVLVGWKLSLVKLDAKVIPGRTQWVSTRSRASLKVSFLFLMLQPLFQTNIGRIVWMTRDGGPGSSGI